MGALKYVNVLGAAGILSGAVLVLTLGAEGVGDKVRQFERQAAGPFEVGAAPHAFVQEPLDCACDTLGRRAGPEQGAREPAVAPLIPAS